MGVGLGLSTPFYFTQLFVDGKHKEWGLLPSNGRNP